MRGLREVHEKQLMRGLSADLWLLTLMHMRTPAQYNWKALLPIHTHTKLREGSGWLPER